MQDFEEVKKELIPFKDTNVETIVGRVNNKIERFVTRTEISRVTGIEQNTLINIEKRNQELFKRLSHNVNVFTVTSSGHNVPLFNLAQVNSYLNYFN